MNREYEYRLEILNRDKIDAHNVRVSQVLPPTVKFVSAGEGGFYLAETRTVVWQVGLVPAGKNRLLSVKLLPQTVGLLLTQTKAHSDQGLHSTLFTVLHAETPATGIAPINSGVVNPVSGRAREGSNH